MQFKLFAAIAAVLCLSFLSTIETVSAAAATTFVSATGSDSNPCSAVATPCVTLQHAHDNTLADGTIVVLTAGSYGPVTITKTISIISDGPEAVIRTGTSTCGSGGFGAAICVNAAASDMVLLSGLTIDLAGAAKHGIRANTVGSLHIGDMRIRRTASLAGGIVFLPASGTGKLFINDTTISDTAFGVAVQPATAASAIATLNRLRLENLTLDGVLLGYAGNGTGSIRAIIRDSSISKAQRNGAAAGNAGGATQSVTMVLDRTSLSEGATALNAEGPGVQVFAADSTVTGNTNAFVVASGALLSSLTSNLVVNNESDSVEARPKRKLKEGRVAR